MKRKVTSDLSFEIKQIKMSSNEVISTDPQLENGILLQSGDITVKLNGIESKLSRKDVFQQLPIFISVSINDKCILEANTETELVIISVENTREFNSTIYIANETTKNHLGLRSLNGADGRTIVDILNSTIEPLSNLAIGEVISDQGSWSSYPPHSHPQPEAYAYKFDGKSGFGVSIVDEHAEVVSEGDVVYIPGNLNHPQVCAPGYRMYYMWVIRNFEDDPWTKRIYQKEHSHLLEEQ